MCHWLSVSGGGPRANVSGPPVPNLAGLPPPPTDDAILILFSRSLLITTFIFDVAAVAELWFPFCSLVAVCGLSRQSTRRVDGSLCAFASLY